MSQTKLIKVYRDSMQLMCDCCCDMFGAEIAGDTVNYHNGDKRDYQLFIDKEGYHYILLTAPAD